MIMLTLTNIIIELRQRYAGNVSSTALAAKSAKLQSRMDFAELGSDQQESKSPEKTRIEMCQIIQSNHINKHGHLSSGQLLKWVDITACLSAEKLAGRPCVTLSVDDLYFEDQVRLGEIICLQGQVNRAFNTSMEVGVKVTTEQLNGEKKKICEAFLTFVAITDVGRKVKLPSFVCESTSEEVCYSLAGERRKVRISHSKTITHLLASYTADETTDHVDLETQQRPAMSGHMTRVESVELVLPSHANHHGNTFGGQVMAWMENVGSISAGRFAKDVVSLRSVDMVHFRGPSRVGDRVVLKAIVNCAFQNSIEVGVRVEAYDCENGEMGEMRHINSAFLTYETAAQLPVLDPSHGQDGMRRYREATARYKIRLDRRYILSSKRQEKLSVVLTEDNLLYLSLDNISSLSQLANKDDWKKVSSEEGLTLSTREQDGILTFKVSKTLCNSKVSDYHAYKILSDPRKRAKWDPLMVTCELVRGKHGVDDCVYHSVMRRTPSEDDENRNHLVLLYSCRKPSHEGEPYIVAIRSVILEDIDCTSQTGNNLIEVACAGFMIRQEPGCNTEVSYYNETNPQLVSYVTCDVAGLSKVYSTVYKRMEKYIADNL